MTAMIQQSSDLAVLLASARLSVMDFDHFLRERERQFLVAHEPEFVRVMQELVSRYPVPDASLLTEKVKPKLRRKPQEWVRLMQETSDVRVGPTHFGGG